MRESQALRVRWARRTSGVPPKIGSLMPPTSFSTLISTDPARVGRIGAAPLNAAEAKEEATT